jgi:hypothetical protein
MEVNYKKYLGIFLTFLISIIIAIPFHLIYYYFTFYIHEAGHIFFGTIGSIIEGKIPNYKINNWITYDSLPFLKIPQTTKGTLNFLLPYGGSLMILIIISLISYILSEKLNTKIFFLFIPLFIFHELIFNFIYGTDNYLRMPLIPKNEIIIDFLVNIFIFFSILILSLIIYLKINKKFIKFLNKKRLKLV